MNISDLQAIIQMGAEQPLIISWNLTPSCIQVGARMRTDSPRYVERVVWADVTVAALHDAMNTAIDRAWGSECNVQRMPTRLRAIDGGLKP